MFKQSLITAVIALVVLGTAGMASALIQHSGSGTHNYPPLTTAAGEDVRAGGTTKVNLLPGGEIGDDLWADDNSTVTVSGGTIGGWLQARDNSTATVSGGEIGGDLYAWNNSTVTVSGGEIVGYLQAFGNSMVTVSGGEIGGGLLAYSTSTVTVSGGEIGGNLAAFDDSTVTIIGSGFNFAYGDYFDGGSLDGLTLTGLLGDGTAINNTVNIDNSATVTLARKIPEPATAAMVLLGAGGLMCRRRAA